jgi:hypothetical protein
MLQHVVTTGLQTVKRGCSMALNRRPILTQEFHVLSPVDTSVVQCCPVSQSVSQLRLYGEPAYIVSQCPHYLVSLSDPYTIQILLLGVGRAHTTAGRLTFILSSKQSCLTEEVDGIEVSDFIHLY